MKTSKHEIKYITLFKTRNQSKRKQTGVSCLMNNMLEVTELFLTDLFKYENETRQYLLPLHPECMATSERKHIFKVNAYT